MRLIARTNDFTLVKFTSIGRLFQIRTTRVLKKNFRQSVVNHGNRCRDVTKFSICGRQVVHAAML